MLPRHSPLLRKVDDITNAVIMAEMVQEITICNAEGVRLVERGVEILGLTQRALARPGKARY